MFPLILFIRSRSPSDLSPRRHPHSSLSIAGPVLWPNHCVCVCVCGISEPISFLPPSSRRSSSPSTLAVIYEPFFLHPALSLCQPIVCTIARWILKCSIFEVSLSLVPFRNIREGLNLQRVAQSLWSSGSASLSGPAPPSSPPSATGCALCSLLPEGRLVPLRLCKSF